MAGQSSDRMISAYKNGRKSGHVRCRLKENVLSNSTLNATKFLKRLETCYI